MLPLSVMLWGGTRPWTGELIAWILSIASLLFVVSTAITGDWRQLDKIAVACVLLIVVPGWVGVLNLVRLPLLPASFSVHLSFTAVILAGGMLGSLLICLDLASSRTWRRRFWITLCLTGAGMVVLGIVQRLTNAQAIFWSLSEYHGGFFFSVFRYHANAGAFMNLVIPMTAGLAVRSFLKKEFTGGTFWTASLLLTVAAAFVNVSRAAQAVTLLLVTVMMLMLANRFRGALPGSHVAWIVSLLILPALLVSIFGASKTLARWNRGIPLGGIENGSFFDTDRGLTYRSIVFHLLPRSGFWGSGPGTFEPVFAEVIREDSLPVKGRWDFAHNDYLQTLSEWGVIPFLALLTLGCAAVTKGFRLWCSKGEGSSTALMGWGGALALSGLMLHALVDFPLQIPSIQLFSSVIAGLLLGAPCAGYHRALRGGNRT